jgi:branched-chain amino acid transport system substrate-binding protein
MKKHLFILLGLVVCTGIVLMSVQAQPSGKPIKVGAVFSITGPAAWLGEPERNTVKMLEEQINAAGGIHGRPLQVIIEDSEGDNTKAVIAVNKLLRRDNVCAIIGPSRSGPSMAVIQPIQRAKVPLISCAAAEQIIELKNTWVFKTPQNDSDCVRRIFDDITAKGLKKVAFISGTTGFGQAGRSQLQKLAVEYQLEIVGDETYGPTDTDMTAQLTRIKSTGAQALVNWSIVPAQSIVPKNMKQLGMTIQLYQSHGFGNIKYVEAAGPAADGLLFPAGALLVVDSLPDSHPQKAILMKYKKEYEDMFDSPASTFGGHAYDALMIVVDAIQTVGDDPAKIREHIENRTGFVGIHGTFNRSVIDHCGLGKDAFEMITVKDGKFVLAE